MAQRKIVHKQFNSPIGLYSNDNVKETLDRELKTLNNGAVGIDFDDPSTTRAGNLAKSAVLAALEEEERERSGRKPGLKRVAWPPSLDESSNLAPVQQQAYEASPAVVHHPVHEQPKAQQKALAPQNFAAPAIEKSHVSPHQPRPESFVGLDSPQNQSFVKPLSPLPQLQTNSPQQHGPIYASPRGWNHVNPPSRPSSMYSTSPNVEAVVPPFQTNDPTNHFNQPQHQAAAHHVSAPNPVVQPAYAPNPNVQPVYAPNPVVQPVYAPNPVVQPVYAPNPVIPGQPFQGSPLRKEAPVTQKPSPVFHSQPIASSFQGGSNRRGDSKWPPSEYKQQSELDNIARKQLALGPAFRPKRVQKDYSGFFAQNALNSTYPGYRIPPVLQNMN